MDKLKISLSGFHLVSTMLPFGLELWLHQAKGLVRESLRRCMCCSIAITTCVPAGQYFNGDDHVLVYRYPALWQSF